MATGGETVRAAGGEYGEAAATVFVLATDRDYRPVDPVIWGDEERMKRELMAWAKAVASMALDVSSAPPPSMGHRRKCTT